MSEGQLNTTARQTVMGVVPDRETAVRSLQERRNIVMTLMDSVLKDGIHYGKISGCGDKPSLFLAGAEQLCAAFMFAPRYKQEIIHRDQHLEVQTTCELYLHDGTFAGEGVSICSTYESKYRYRGGAGEPTGELVPRNYWDLKKSAKKEDQEKAQDLLGGKGYTAKKIDGKWMVCVYVEKQENPDLADQWNTVVKMSAKRALVHAVRTSTGTADVWTQDIEDFRDSYGTVLDAEVVDPHEATPPKAAPQPAGQPMPSPAPRQSTAENGWDLSAQETFASLLDNDLYTQFQRSGHTDLFDEERKKWAARRGSDEASKVISGLRDRIATMAAAADATIAKRQASNSGSSQVDPAPPPTSTTPAPQPSAAPVPPQERAMPGVESAEYDALSKKFQQEVCDRFRRYYESQNLPHPVELAKQKRAQIMQIESPKWTSKMNEAQRRMALVEALLKEADHMKIPK